jgi:N6-adenosine-specific RNA methylase IME4
MDNHDDYEYYDGSGHWVECGYERMYHELMSNPREKAHATEVTYYRRKIRELEAEVARRMVPQSSALLDAFARAQERDAAEPFEDY